MNNSCARLNRLAVAAVIAALYAVLTMILAPISYGAVQCRISEVLCILPFFLPYTSFGLFAGCFVANLLTGNIFDIIFGSLATLAAALCTAAAGKSGRSMGHCILACFMPVIFNAVVVGAVITGAYEGMNLFEHAGVWAVNGLWVGLGEAVVLYVLGLPLLRLMPKNRFFSEFIENHK